MTGEYQDVFFFDDEDVLESSEPPDRLSDFFDEVSRAWGIPVGQRVNLRLRDAALPELTGKLKLVRPPDLPLDPSETLALTLNGIEFTHRQIAAWSLC